MWPGQPAKRQEQRISTTESWFALSSRFILTMLRHLPQMKTLSWRRVMRRNGGGVVVHKTIHTFLHSRPYIPACSTLCRNCSRQFARSYNFTIGIGDPSFMWIGSYLYATAATESTTSKSQLHIVCYYKCRNNINKSRNNNYPFSTFVDSNKWPK